MNHSLSEHYVPIEDSELLAPSAILVLDSERYISILSLYGISDQVNEEEGLYLPWSNRPFLPAGVYYPVGKRGDAAYAITDLNAVVDANCSVVHELHPKKIINRQLILKYKKLLTPKPPINVPMVDLIMGYIANTIINKAPVNKYHLDRFLSTDGANLLVQANRNVCDQIDVCLDDLYLTTHTFIGKDKWHLYDLHRKGRSIIIEKLIDYRIYDWYKIQRGLIENGDQG